MSDYIAMNIINEYLLPRVPHYEKNSLTTEKFAHPEPRISVLLITYMHKIYIGQCIQSEFSQTLRSYELLIYDDHSTDQMWKTLQKYAMQHSELILAYRQPQNVGAGYWNCQAAEVSIPSNWLNPKQHNPF
jgi:hypothetical protein